MKYVPVPGIKKKKKKMMLLLLLLYTVLGTLSYLFTVCTKTHVIDSLLITQV